MHLPRPLWMLYLVTSLYLWCGLNVMHESECRSHAYSWQPSWFCASDRRSGFTMCGIGMGDEVATLQHFLEKTPGRYSQLSEGLNVRIYDTCIIDRQTGTELRVISDDGKIVDLDAIRHCSLELNGQEILRQGEPTRDFMTSVAQFSETHDGITRLHLTGQPLVSVSSHGGIVSYITMWRD